jgi:Tfp pilus assembly protein PilO
MSRPILSTTLIIIAGIIFFSFTDPVYKELKALNLESSQFDEALNRSKELQAIRDELLSRYNTFSTEDLDKIEKLLPDNVENVRLILDIDNIASKYGMLIKDVSVLNEGAQEKSDAVTIEGELGRIVLSFNITSPYDDFKRFIRDLEQSLRLVDIKGLSFRQRDNSNLMDFGVTIETYWLK